MRFTVAGIAALAAAVAVGTGLAPAGAADTAVESRADARALGRADVTSQDVTVIVQLEGAPVAVAGAAARTALGTAQRSAHRDKLRKEQGPVAERVRGLGGAVLGEYQSAYNGLKVRIARKQLDRLARLSGVRSVHAIRAVTMADSRGLPFIDAPSTWGNGVTGVHGEGIRIAVVDSGIDYTHADFGGPGTPAAYDAAHAAEASPADPAWFGHSAPKVKGGIDLAGDTYDADPSSETYQPVPHPDRNPLDCNGHGTHVAGTAAGFGVRADGRPYRGLYSPYTLTNNTWRVAPGVAPKADLYAVRIFGCQGASDLLIDALDWAVQNDMDVVNLSLASPFGKLDSPEAVAADNAVKDGILVVGAAGGDGAAGPYLTGAPASGDQVISVAAGDHVPRLPGVHVTVNDWTTIDAVVVNGAAAPSGRLETVLLRDANGQISDGCDPALWTTVPVAGKFVLTSSDEWTRCSPATIERNAARFGAAAVFVTSHADPQPSYGGGAPDDGTVFETDVPVLAPVSGYYSSLYSPEAGSLDLTPFTFNNPGFRGVANFSSSGPRFGDSWLKPDVTAPGLTITSAGVGTGSGGRTLSGSSMASAFTSGVAALVKQAHPTWKVTDLRAAIVSTADATKIRAYAARRAGNGLVQTPGAVRTEVVAVGTQGSTALNFGYAELSEDLTATRWLTVRNLGDTPVHLTATTAKPHGNPHTVTLGTGSLVVPAHAEAALSVRLSVPAATAGPGNSQDVGDVAGLVVLTPADGENSGVRLRVPYYLAPEGVADVRAELDVDQLVRTGEAPAVVRNHSAALSGTSNWYTWGLKDGDEPANRDNDIRAVGVIAQSGLSFVIALHQAPSNPGVNQYEVAVDVHQDGTDDFVAVAADRGVITTGRPDGGGLVGVVRDLSTGGTTTFRSPTAFGAPNSNAVHLNVPPIALNTPGATFMPEGTRFSYSVTVRGLFEGTTDTVQGVGTSRVGFPAFDAEDRGVIVLPGKTGTTRTLFDATAFAASPALGFLVLNSTTNRRSIQLIPVDPAMP